jgi:hypothetical protein
LKGRGTTTMRFPAAMAARMPFVESSTATERTGSASRRRVTSTWTLGAGLPRPTSRWRGWPRRSAASRPGRGPARSDAWRRAGQADRAVPTQLPHRLEGAWQQRQGAAVAVRRQVDHRFRGGPRYASLNDQVPRPLLCADADPALAVVRPTTSEAKTRRGAPRPRPALSRLGPRPGRTPLPRLAERAGARGHGPRPRR